MSEISEIEIKSMTKEQNYMRGYEDGKSDVLNKIRTEIENLTYYWCEVNPKNVIDDVLEIIAKVGNKEYVIKIEEKESE